MAMEVRRRHGAAVGIALFSLVQAAAAETTLIGHTLPIPPEPTKLAKDWFLAGTVIPSTRALVLNPGVPQRVGMFWNLYPVLSNDFEVSFKLSIKAPEKRTATQEGFAFWYVNENASAAQENVSLEHVQNQEAIIANTWEVAMATHGFELFGYRNMFDGLGVVFNSNAAGKAVVSSMYNDGKKDIKFDKLENTMEFDRTKEVDVKIRVQAAVTKVEILGGASVNVGGDFKAGGYIGMTAFGGKKGDPSHEEKADFVELKDWKVVNFDAKAEGEKMPQEVTKVPDLPKKPEEKTDVLADSSSFKDHRAESDAIKELTNMVFKLTMETQPMRVQLESAISSLGKRITAMEETFENLKKEIDKKTGHHLGKEFDAIKQELSSLSSVASEETKERHKRLETLHEDIADVHKTASSPDNIDHHLSKLTESNQRTLNSLTNEHQKMFGVSIAAIGFVIIAGLSLYNKFRCWEKKHIL